MGALVLATASPLANGYPTVEVDHDAIYIRDGNWTPAGVTAGIDRALTQDRGRKTAAAVARQLVVDLRRSDGGPDLLETGSSCGHRVSANLAGSVQLTIPMWDGPGNRVNGEPV